jgi:type II secretory pathway component GspD/PulD (secretin)
MTSAVKISVRLAFLAAISLHAQTAQVENPNVQYANDEAVRRQEKTIEMHQLLEQARAAVKRNQLLEAAKIYQLAVADISLAQVGNPTVEADKKAAVAGLDEVEVKLAHLAMDVGDLARASNHLELAIKSDPYNQTLLKFKAELALHATEQTGRVPSPDVVARVPGFEKQKIDVATKVQNAKLLYEMGKYDEAEVILNQVMKDDPSNRSAPYYLDLIKEARYMDKARLREAVAKSSTVEVENAWIPPTKQESLPVPNPMMSNTLVYTSPGRQRILTKLDSILFDSVAYDMLLKDVLVDLKKKSALRDTEGKGVNFMINKNIESSGALLGPTDTTGAAAAGAVPAAGASQQQDIGGEVTITIAPPLEHLTLRQVLDAICGVADKPIRYTIEDYAVVFAPPQQDIPRYYTRRFRVNPDTFVQGLENVFAVTLNFGTQTAGGGSGGASGGGGGGGGGGSTGQSIGGTIPGVQIAPITQSQQGGGGGLQAQGGGGAGGRGQIGLSYVTRTNNTADSHLMVMNYFRAIGLDFQVPGKTVLFNDRLGELLVRGTTADLELVAQAIELLNQTPPQVTIEAKFADLSQEDSRGLGFNWYLGNTLMNNGAIGLQGGSAPSYQGPSTQANPSGIFPGGGSITPGTTTITPGPGVIPASATDGLLTSGIRNEYGSGLSSLPTLGTITGIMTDPQFRVAVQAIEQRTGSDLLAAPKVTTESGRQAHLAAQDLVTIVTSAGVTGNTGSSGAFGGGASSVAQSITYSTTFLALGPSLDVIPTVCSDGYSISMALIPTYTEFIGYDNPGQFVPQAQVGVGSTVSIPITAQLPLPHFRIRQVATACDVWDGQTIVLGGLISETITKIHDKVPVLGDLPFFGNLFQSQSSDSTKENLLIFVTPTIIDPAGNRVHTDEDMPFAKTGIPIQKAPPTQ